MGQLLEALKQIEDRSPLSRPAEPIPVESLASVDQDTTSRRGDRRAATADQDRHAPVDPRYRELIGAILCQVALHDHTVLLIAGFGDDEPRGGQLAGLYPLLGEQIDGGLLVVDVDFRNAPLAERFDLRHGHGLADVLTKGAAWQDVVQGTRHTGLYLLPGGKRGQEPFAGNGPEGTSHKRFLTPFSPRLDDLSGTLAELRHAHRLVVLDTILSTPQEMAAWATRCDAAVLAVRLGVTPRRHVRQTIRAIQARGGAVLGCVLLQP